MATRGNGLRIGIAGKRGAAFVAGLRSIPDVHVSAFCELNPETLRTVADRHDIPERYQDFDAMLQSDLDAIVVATPMHFHVPQSVAALQSGKHVLCEVTAAVSLEECPRLVEAVRQSGRVYMMAENYCYTKPNVLVRHLAREGLFGELYYAEGAYIHDCHVVQYDAEGKPTWRTVWQVGKNGCTYGTHSLGPVLQWLDDKLVSVSCLGSGVHTEPRHRMDDTVTMLGKTTRGGLVNIRLDMQSHRPHNMTHYALQGTKGAYQSARRAGEPNLIWLEGRSPSREVWEDLASYEAAYLPEPWRSWEKEATATGHGGGDFFVARAFATSILDGTPPPIDVDRALDFTVPGLVSEQSIAQDGIPLPVPVFRCSSAGGKGTGEVHEAEAHQTDWPTRRGWIDWRIGGTRPMSSASVFGKVAIVTGAAMGIGAAISERFAGSGADLFLRYHNRPGRLDKLVARLRGQQRRVVPFVAREGGSGEDHRREVVRRRPRAKQLRLRQTRD